MKKMYVNTDTFMNHPDHIFSHTALIHEDHHETRDETNHHGPHMFLESSRDAEQSLALMSESQCEANW